MAGFHRAVGGEVGLAKLEDQVRRQLGVVFEEVDEVAEEVLVGQGVRRDVAEEAEVLALALDLAHHLDAAEELHVVDGGDQAGLLGDRDVLFGEQLGAVVGRQAGEALVEAPLALRQADDRLNRQVDAVVAQGLADLGQNVGIGDGAVAPPRGPDRQRFGGNRHRCAAAGRGDRDRLFGRRGRGQLPDQRLQHLHFLGHGLGRDAVLGKLSTLRQALQRLAHRLHLAAGPGQLVVEKGIGALQGVEALLRLLVPDALGQAGVHQAAAEKDDGPGEHGNRQGGIRAELGEEKGGTARSGAVAAKKQNAEDCRHGPGLKAEIERVIGLHSARQVLKEG